MGQVEPRCWAVGALARAAGVTVRTLHHYDRVGLLVPSGRSGGGHRRYSEADVARLYRILALRGFGFALEQIPDVLDHDDPASLLAIVHLQRERTDQRLTACEQLRIRLDDMIRQLEHQSAPPTDQLLDLLETMTMTVQLTRIYTRLGDDGGTHLADLSRVPKTEPRIEALGAVDELNAAVGVALATVEEPPAGYGGWLRQIQNDLFDLGADLSHPAPSSEETPDQAVDEAYVNWVEGVCDQVNEDLSPLRSFVLPGGSMLAAQLHVCRTVCRRAERRVLAVPDVSRHVTRYLNRLSDLLFILSRAANSAEEPVWQPRRRTA